ncbi:MAG TPA: hypothetical protein VKO38_07015 [Wenzhouxiangella sp.]|nr:hypothetical protein [Wenzhouxiangella sp.]
METRLNISERAAQIGASAASLVRRVRMLGLSALLSACWLWLVLFVFVGNIPHFLLAIPAAVLGLVLLLPGIIVITTTLGLNSLAQLPAKLGAKPSREPSESEGRRRGPFALLRRLWGIRREVVGYKTVLISYAGAIRLFTLPFLLVISIAILACLFQIALTMISLPLVALALLL